MTEQMEIIIFDTEYTAWEGNQERGWDGINEFKEIVQIGAVCINAETLAEQSFISLYIKPARNPILSEYFSNLTGIKQEIIETEGEGFLQAIIRFTNWVGDRPLYSFGGDERELIENCLMLNIEFPMIKNNFYNAKKIFINAGIDLTNFTSGTITEAFGVAPKEPAHNALHDARSIAEGLRLLKKRDGKLIYEL